jgi:ubiquinone/menaquinone biosynthesis C-methylase UbiE
MGTKKYETGITYKYYWESLNTIDSYVSFLNQIKEIYNLKPKSVLEIGIGNKILQNQLKSIGLEVTTVDINTQLKPDVVADVRQLPFSDNSFDVACAFEVLEHIPFEDFEVALQELKRVSKKHVVISLPISKIGFEFSMWLPFIHHIYFYLPFPITLKHKGVTNDTDCHYFEVNKKGFSKTKILNIFKKHFKVLNHFSPKFNKHHWIIILEKKSLEV